MKKKSRPEPINFAYIRKNIEHSFAVLIIGYHGYKHSVNCSRFFSLLFIKRKYAGCVFFSWLKKKFDLYKETDRHMKKKSRPEPINFAYTRKNIAYNYLLL